jgi:hypothetical protein
MNSDTITATVMASIALIELVIIIVLLLARSVRIPRPGDIVLYSGKNMITSVVDVDTNLKMARIRVEGSTMIIPLNTLQVLNIDMAYPLQVPSRPKADYVIPASKGVEADLGTIYEDDTLPQGAHVVSPYNMAHFNQCPISWFFPFVIINDQKELQTVIK